MSSSEIYFCGFRLDDLSAEQPIVIRGYDSAGNQIVSIRYEDTIETTYEFVGGYQDRYHFDAFTSEGEPISAWIATSLPRAWPFRVATSKDGWIYVASGPIYSGTGDVLTDFFRVYRRGGDRVAFPQLHGARIRTIKVGADGSIYVAGHQSGTIVARKYTSGGALLWSGVIGDWPENEYLEMVHDACLDASGNLYCVGSRWIFGFIRKYNSGTGALEWTRWLRTQFTPPTPYTILCYAGDLYVASQATSATMNPPSVTPIPLIDGETHRFAVTRWTTSGAFICGGIDNIWAGQQYVSDATWAWISASTSQIIAQCRDGVLRRLNPVTLGILSETSLPHYSLIAAEADGTTYFAGTRKSVGYAELQHFRCFRADGSEPWDNLSATGVGGVDPYGVARPVNAQDTTYAGNVYLTPYGVQAGPDMGYNSDLGRYDFWGINSWYVDDEDFHYGAASVFVDQSPSTRSIKLGISLSVPLFEGDRYSAVPGIPLGVALALPLTRRDYVGALRLAEIFRVRLAGDLWLPASSISIRRDLTQSAVTVVVPTAEASIVASVIARDGQPLEIYRGVRFPDGSEQSDVMLSVALASIRYDRGAGRGSMTLSGAALTQSGVSRPRQIKGVSYRSGLTGRRRLRCALDTYLRPGDVALFAGGESLTVSELSCAISPSGAAMEISE